MNIIGIIVNTSKPKAATVAIEVSDWLKSQRITPLIPEEQASDLGIPSEGYTPEQVASMAEALIVLGGDGTMLRAAHIPHVDKVPILGINLGHLGYLTEVALNELYPALNNLLSGNYGIEERMMLRAEVYQNGEVKMQSFALNDLVIRHPVHMIQIEAHIDGEYFVTYHGDGLIIATPTGSTAYSLSAGGPIVAPDMDAFILTPIASHALTLRPFIANANSRISVIVRSNHGNTILAVDGMREMPCLEPDCEVVVTKAEKTIKLVKTRNKSYFKALRAKLKLGDRGE